MVLDEDTEVPTQVTDHSRQESHAPLSHVRACERLSWPRRRVIAMDRAHDVRVPAVDAAHGQRPQRTKIKHFMTRGIGLGQDAHETLVAGTEFVELIARNGGEASPWSGRRWRTACRCARWWSCGSSFALRE